MNCKFFIFYFLLYFFISVEPHIVKTPPSTLYLNLMACQTFQVKVRTHYLLPHLMIGNFNFGMSWSFGKVGLRNYRCSFLKVSFPGVLVNCINYLQLPLYYQWIKGLKHHLWLVFFFLRAFLSLLNIHSYYNKGKPHYVHVAFCFIFFDSFFFFPFF